MVPSEHVPHYRLKAPSLLGTKSWAQYTRAGDSREYSGSPRKVWLILLDDGPGVWNMLIMRALILLLLVFAAGVFLGNEIGKSQKDPSV